MRKDCPNNKFILDSFTCHSIEFLELSIAKLIALIIFHSILSSFLPFYGGGGVGVEIDAGEGKGLCVGITSGFGEEVDGVVIG